MMGAALCWRCPKGAWVENDDGVSDAGLRAGALAEAVRAAAAGKSLPESLAAVIALAVDTGPCEAASITMRTGRQVESVAYSHEVVLKADSLQYDLREGPCLDAAWNDDVFVIPDLRADGRWP